MQHLQKVLIKNIIYQFLYSVREANIEKKEKVWFPLAIPSATDSTHLSHDLHPIELRYRTTRKPKREKVLQETMQDWFEHVPLLNSDIEFTKVGDDLTTGKLPGRMFPATWTWAAPIWTDWDAIKGSMID